MTSELATVNGRALDVGQSEPSAAERWGRARDLLVECYAELKDLLTSVETVRTAETELRWLMRGFEQSATRALPFNGVDCYSILPATLPLYSTFLFALVPEVAGAQVTCRPASASATVVEHFMAQVLAPAELRVSIVGGSREDSVARAAGADAVIFTGGTQSADSLVRMLAEETLLIYQGPGVCASVVGPTADPATAAKAIVTDRIFNNGQDCMATERVYVHTSVMQEFVEGTRQVASRLVTGPSSGIATDLGPLLHPDAFRSSLSKAWADTANRWILLSEEDSRYPGAHSLGLCVSSPDSETVLGETYGPLLPVVPYRSVRELREMIALGDFALGASVHGEPGFRTQEFDFAHVAIGASLYDFEVPFSSFGGYRRSSFVRRDGEITTGPLSLYKELSR
jgi:acyl-CoA reductase-like NAD-dependent aldehyde dehydrogenase